MSSGQPTSIYRQPRLPKGKRPGPTPVRRPSRQRQTPRPTPRQQGTRLYELKSPEQFDLSQLARVENLHRAYRVLEQEGGHGAGVDRLTFGDLSNSEMWTALRAVSTALSEQAYRPQPTRTIQIPKGNGGIRTLSLQTILDRTVAKAVQVAVTPCLHTAIGKPLDVYGVYAAMQTHIRRSGHYVIASDDIRDCFPSAPLEHVLSCFGQHFSQPDLSWLIETVVRGHCGPEHLTGLDQGSPLSPVALELLLHHRLDTQLEVECPGYPLLRYVDNLTFLCSSAREGEDLLQITGEILNRSGFSLLSKEKTSLRQICETNHGESWDWKWAGTVDS